MFNFKKLGATKVAPISNFENFILQLRLSSLNSSESVF